MLLPMREPVVTGTDYYCRVPCVHPLTESHISVACWTDGRAAHAIGEAMAMLGRDLEWEISLSLRCLSGVVGTDPGQLLRGFGFDSCLRQFFGLLGGETKKKLLQVIRTQGD